MGVPLNHPFFLDVSFKTIQLGYPHLRNPPYSFVSPAPGIAADQLSPGDWICIVNQHTERC